MSMGVIVAALGLGVCLAAMASADGFTGPNLIKNPSFTEGEANWGFQKPYQSVATDVGRTDKFSMHYSGKPGTPYVLCAQSIPISGGKYYTYGAWVKMLSVAGQVKICVEWANENGYVGGNYIDTHLHGTADWQQVSFASSRVPNEATSLHLVLYADAGTTGDIWFDDAEVREVTNPPVKVEYPDPIRHGREIAAVDQCPDIRVSLSLDPKAGLDPKNLKVQAVLMETDSVPPSAKIEVSEWNDGKAEVIVPTKSMPLGVCRLGVDVIDPKTGRSMFRETQEITKFEQVRLDVMKPNTMGVAGALPGQSLALEGSVTCRLPKDAPPESYDLVLTLVSSKDGSAVGPSILRRIRSGETLPVVYPMDKAPLGTNDLRAEIFKPGTKERIALSEKTVTRVDPKNRPANAVDVLPNGLVSVDGKAFLPLGFYIESSLDTDSLTSPIWKVGGAPNPKYYEKAIELIGRSPFNCIMDYCGDYKKPVKDQEAVKRVLDFANQRGVKVIYSAKDFVLNAIDKGDATLENRDLLGGVLREVKEHPAVLAIYVNDETYGPGAMTAYRAAARMAREEDPWHPTYSVQYHYPSSPQLAKLSDVYGTDPYTITGDIGQMVKSYRTAREAMPDGQPMWAVVQAFGSGYETGNFANTQEPTRDEMRCGTYCALAEGATGIIYYALHSMQRSPRFPKRWRELCSIAQEVRDLTPIIAMPTASTPVRVTKGDLSIRTKQGDGKFYVILASPARREQSVRVEWPAGVSRVFDLHTSKALTLDKGATEIELPALAARVLVGEP